MQSTTCFLAMFVMARLSFAQMPGMYGGDLQPGSQGSGGIPGGLISVSVNGEDIQRIARLAVSKLGSEYSLVRVTRARTQVVMGTMYHLTLVVKRTGPNPTDVWNLICTVKMHEVVWLSQLELIEPNCRQSLRY